MLKCQKEKIKEDCKYYKFTGVPNIFNAKFKTYFYKVLF